MENWSEALQITLTGLGVVFGVMGIIAAATWASGRVFISLEGREKERKEAEKEAKQAEKEAKKKARAAEKAKAAAEAEASGADEANEAPAEAERAEGGS